MIDVTELYRLKSFRTHLAALHLGLAMKKLIPCGLTCNSGDGAYQWSSGFGRDHANAFQLCCKF